MSPAATLPDWLLTAFQAFQKGDIEPYLALYAPDAVHEFPFAPEGAPPRLEGIGAISAYMRQLPARIRFGSFSDVRVREAGEELIIEATGHHFRLPENAPLTISYVWFITRRNAKITQFRDYMNPLQLFAPAKG